MSKNVLYYGQAALPPQRVPLCAGPLSMVYENGDLRYVCYNDKLVLLRVYAAARDRHWGTAPAVLSDVTMDLGENRFHIRYTCENKLSDVDFVWQGEVVGEADGDYRDCVEAV